MLGHAKHTFVVAACIPVACAAVIGACGGSAEPEATRVAPPSSLAASPSDSAPGTQAGTPNYSGGESIRSMVENYQYVVLGRAIGISGNYERRISFDPPVPDALIPFHVYSVQVIEPISATGILPGENIPVLVSAPYGLDDIGDRLDAGATYLFFLGDSRGFGDPGLTSLPHVRFPISEDGRVTANDYEFLPGVLALEGQTLIEAGAGILAAIAEGPLPFVCNAPVCTPTPSPKATPEPSAAPVPSS